MEHRGHINTGGSESWEAAVVSVSDTSVRVLVNQFEVYAADRSDIDIAFETGQPGVIGISSANETIWFRPANFDAFRVDVKGATTAADRLVLAQANAAPPPMGASATAAAGGYRAALANAMRQPGKDKIVAVLLAVFLGAFGIHHFYLGTSKYGVLRICLLPLVVNPLGWLIFVAVHFAEVVMVAIAQE